MIPAIRQFFSELPISKKLMMMVIILIFGIIVITNIAFVVTVYAISKEQIAPNHIKTIAQLLTEQEQNRKLVDDTAFASRQLQVLVDGTEAFAAAIYSQEGNLLAHALAPEANYNFPELLAENQKTLVCNTSCLLQPLKTDNQEIGWLLIRYDSEVPIQFIVGTFAATILVILISSLLTRAVITITQRLITKPIIKLTSLAQTVADIEDYSVRANKFYDDEVGSLVTAFNRMLSRVEERDQLLKTARDKSDKASQRAQTLAEETRKANTRLELEVQVRTKIETKLTDFQNYLNNIIDSMPSALIAVDGHFFVTQWNKEASQLSGTPVEDALNCRLVEAFPALGEYSSIISRSLVEKKIQKIEKVEQFFQNEPRFFDIVIYPLSSTAHTGAVIRMDDITHRLRLEDAMVQTEKMMTVGGLAAGMAHEINNPLGAIIQSVQNLSRRLSTDLPKNTQVAAELGTDMVVINQYLEQRNIKQFLDAILDAGNRAAAIVTNMLQFSRRSDKTLINCNLTELMDRIVDIARSDYNLAKGFDFKLIDIKKTFDDTLTAVPCASTEIEQVVLNLLKNAAQAIAERKDPEWQGQITLSTEKKGNTAIISVEDNGTGMNEDTRKRIFEPFFTTKDVGSGTGLGLSVSYFIITTNHKGAMEVQSTKGVGTKFIISLPLTEAQNLSRST